MCSSKPLVLLSVAARAHARDATANGFRVFVGDGYESADLVAERHTRIPMRDGQFCAEALGALAECAGEPVGLAYGAGLEAHPEWLDLLPASCALHGNASEVLRRCSSPYVLYSELMKLGIPCPETTVAAPPDPKGWLIKEAGRSGGAHVRRARRSEPGPGSCWQRLCPGGAYSVLFLAASGAVRMVGASRLLARREPGDAFGWSGAVAPVQLPARATEQVQWAVQALAREWDLLGLGGMDFLMDRNANICVVDVNPRLTATAELYPQRFARGYVRAHVETCIAGRPMGLSESDATGMRGIRVVYASAHSCVVASDAPWSAEVRDRPQTGEVFAPGDPVCTVSGCARQESQLRARLDRAVCGALSRLGPAPGHV